MTIAGSGGMMGGADGQGTSATFYNPRGVAFDKSGALYVTNNNHIRKLSTLSGGTN